MCSMELWLNFKCATTAVDFEYRRNTATSMRLGDHDHLNRRLFRLQLREKKKHSEPANKLDSVAWCPITSAILRPLKLAEKNSMKMKRIKSAKSNQIESRTRGDFSSWCIKFSSFTIHPAIFRKEAAVCDSGSHFSYRCGGLAGRSGIKSRRPV